MGIYDNQGLILATNVSYFTLIFIEKNENKYHNEAWACEREEKK